MDKEINSSVPERALSLIKSGQVTMRPKWYFILQSTLAITGGIFLGLTLLYLVSFIWFALRQSGILFAPSLGQSGWWELLRSLPCLLIVVAMAFMVVLELLVRQVAFSYRRPLLYTIAGILLFVIIGGGLVAATSFQHRLFMSAEHHRLPFGGDFYRSYGHQHMPNVERGLITTTTDHGFIIANQQGESMLILITPRTRLPLGAEFSTGDEVVVFGERRGDTVPAMGVREIGE